MSYSGTSYNCLPSRFEDILRRFRALVMGEKHEKIWTHREWLQAVRVLDLNGSGFIKMSDMIFAAQTHGNKNSNSVTLATFFASNKRGGKKSVRLSTEDIESLYTNIFLCNPDLARLENFVTILRGPIASEKLLVVNAIFDKLDRRQKGVVSFKDIPRFFKNSTDLDIVTGKKSPELIFSAALRLFGSKNEEDQSVYERTFTWWGFYDYYWSLSTRLESANKFSAAVLKFWCCDYLLVEEYSSRVEWSSPTQFPQTRPIYSDKSASSRRVPDSFRSMNGDSNSLIDSSSHSVRSCNLSVSNHSVDGSSVIDKASSTSAKSRFRSAGRTSRGSSGSFLLRSSISEDINDPMSDAIEAMFRLDEECEEGNLKTISRSVAGPSRRQKTSITGASIGANSVGLTQVIAAAAAAVKVAMASDCTTSQDTTTTVPPSRLHVSHILAYGPDSMQ